jgi:hypothetical protein
MKRAFTMTSTGMTGLVLAALAAAILAGCASQWTTTTWTPERICEVAHGGEYGGDGICYYQSPSS